MTTTSSRRRCVIVDDEPIALRFLAGLVERYLPELTLVGETDSVDGAVALIQREQPDIVFLDAEIIGGRGVDVVNRLPAPDIRYILCSASDLAEFRGRPNVAVLLKPIDIATLIDVVRMR